MSAEERRILFLKLAPIANRDRCRLRSFGCSEGPRSLIELRKDFLLFSAWLCASEKAESRLGRIGSVTFKAISAISKWAIGSIVLSFPHPRARGLLRASRHSWVGRMKGSTGRAKYMQHTQRESRAPGSLANPREFPWRVWPRASWSRGARDASAI
jgi:hypothetical protein